MEDNELEEIRQSKLAALQEQIQAEQQEQLQVQQEILQLEIFVKKKLTKDALERFGNLKAAHPELAVQLLIILNQAINAGKVHVIDDELLKSVLKKVQSGKRETKIIRR